MRKISILLTVLFAATFLTVSSAQANCGNCCPAKQEAQCPKADGEKQCPNAEQNKEGSPNQTENAGAEKTEGQAQ